MGLLQIGGDGPNAALPHLRPLTQCRGQGGIRSRLVSLYGSGLSNTASTLLNKAEMAPIPRVSVSTPTSAFRLPQLAQVSSAETSFEVPAIARVKSLPSDGKLGRRNWHLRSPRDRQFHSAPGTSGEGNAEPTHDVVLRHNSKRTENSALPYHAGCPI